MRRVIGSVLAALAFLLVPSAGALTQQQEVYAPDGFTQDLFGYSVAVDGNTMIVGAPDDDVGGHAERGSAYVFVRSGGAWILQQQLIVPDGTDGDYFGWSVALSGDTALVGAPFDDVQYNFGSVTDQGSAYAFVRNPATGAWSLQVQLEDTVDPRTGDHVGFSVALDGDTALVGARDDDVQAPGGGGYVTVDQGSAFVFVRSGTVWTRQAQLIDSDQVYGIYGDHFGAAVALDGTTAVVGAPSDNVGSFAEVGSASVFVRSGTTWTPQIPKLIANDGTGGDRFGTSVAVSGNTALVGAPYDDVGVDSDEGSAYVFVRSGGAWTQQGHLVIDSDSSYGYRVGLSVALSGDTALLGAPYKWSALTGQEPGGVYVFTRGGTTWTRTDLLAPYAGSSDSPHVGMSVSYDGTTAVLGADDKDGTYTNQGAVYVYGQPPTAVAATVLSARRSGTVALLSWRGSDTSILGYRVYRGLTRVSRLLACDICRFVDPSAPPGRLWYRLEAVRFDGSVMWAGSVEIGPQSERKPRRRLCGRCRPDSSGTAS